MRRSLFAAALFSLSLAPAFAEGTQFRDSEGRFTLNVPAGWQSAVPEEKGSMAVFLASPRDEAKPGTGGICMVMADATPQTKDTPQAELDEAFAQVLTGDFWKKSLAAGGLKNIFVQDSGQKVQRGRKIYFFVATASVTDAEGTFEATSKQVVHVVPGSLYFVQCSATKAAYTAMSPAFEKVFASFEPRVNELLVMGPRSAPSVLTMFSAPGFDGVAHAIAQNTANIPALTGKDVAAGISVVGYGAWEICENVNFTGACQIIAATQAAEPGRFIRIGSVRRAEAAKGPAAAAGIISAGTSATFKATLDLAH
ncbi:MAG: PsbP-related protein [Micropepsaceae bacterium]